MVEPLPVSLLFPLAVGILTALVSVRLALRRFRTERWWERKVEAYTSVLTSLFHIQRSIKAQIRRIEEGVELSQGYTEELNRRARDGYSEVRRAAMIGTFLMSEEATARVEALVGHLDDPRHNLDPYEELTADLQEVTGALQDLKRLAKRDLLVRS